MARTIAGACTALLLAAVTTWVASPALAASVQLSSPDRVAYQLNRTTLIGCIPWNHDRYFACTGGRGVGFTYLNARFGTVTSEDGSIGSGIDFRGRRARARQFRAHTDAIVDRFGNLAAAVHKAVHVIARAKTVTSWVTGGAAATLGTSGDSRLSPLGAAVTKAANYVRASDTMEIVDGVHRIEIVGYGSASPRVEVYSGSALLYRTP